MKPEQLLEKIHQAKAEQWTTLDLSNQGITKLPPEIGQLQALQKLHLSHNHLSQLPSEIGQLQTLEQLDLWNNQLNQLPPEIGQLQTLQALYLYNNRHLSRLPPQIGQLQTLKTLHLYNNQLSHLPPEIWQLQRLQSLHLGHNQLSHLPPEIGQLNALQSLHLCRNQLSQLPPEVGQLKNLQVLDLKGNYLSSLRAELNCLTNLRVLDIRDNPCPLSESIAKLRKQGAGVYIPQHCSDLPEEFLQKYSWQIYDYLRSSEMRSLNEAKLILVGDGVVGKTCLVNRLLHDTFEVPQKTEGIDRHQWQGLAVNGYEVRLNVWDFGGQEVLHATHQFFLTKRSVYLLVLDARRGEQESRLEYWLKLIQSFGSDSPILIVINKTDEEHRLTLNQRFLKDKYPGISGFYPTSCTTGMGIADLKQGIHETVAHLPHIHDLMPASWFKLKESLEQRPDNYISYEAYQRLCEEHEIIQAGCQDTLCGFLHDLGVVLNFREDARFDRLRETNVLNPEWVTNAVYKLLNTHELFKNHGVFVLADLALILDKSAYPSFKEHQFIIDMMQKFELCFPISDTQSFLIPELLQNEEPDLNWNKADSLRFQYHYDILPHSVFSRFIVRLHNIISQKTYWRTGVVLTHENNKALITADIEDRKIFVWVNGNPATRRVLLGIIRKEFKHIHGTIKGLEAKEKVPYKNAAIDYQHLLDLEEMGEDTFIPEGLKEKVSVQSLLAGVDNKMIKKKIFLASSSELKTDREQFEIFINRRNKVLIDKGVFLELILWEDFLDAMSVTRLQDEYNKAIRECDIFLMLFCTKVGMYTEEEFTTAFGQFEASKKPRVFTYFKKSDVPTTELNRDDVQSLWRFQDKLKNLGHFPTIYNNIEDLQLQFTQQLEKLALY